MFKLHLSRANVLLAAVHFFTGLFLLSLINLAYANIPYYVDFIHPDLRMSFPSIFTLLAIALFVDTIRLLGQVEFPRTDLLLIYLSLLQLAIKRRIELDVHSRKAWLYLILKIFFLPIMLNTVVQNLSVLEGVYANLSTGKAVINLFDVAVTVIFLLDTLIFSFGYLFAAKFLGNEVKSVDPRMWAWVVALITYPPFNAITGQFLPLYHDNLINNFLPTFAQSLLQVLILLCHLLFLLATFSLGPRASNLTSRGVVNWGMYRFVRHPAYAAKLAAWFFTGVLYANSLSYFFVWGGYAMIYFLRALSEEQHLEQTDAAYSDYRKRVRYWFVPKVL